MGFRFAHDETVDQAFRRITKHQIAKAHKHLAFGEDPTKAVFEARKSMKRLRALLRLYRPALGKSDYASENVRYRNIGRLLSSTRDHHVVVETTTMLRRELEAGKPHGKAKTTLKGLLALQKLMARDAKPDENAQTITHEVDTVRVAAASTRRAISFLDDAQHELSLLRLKGTGFSMVRRGLEASYRQCQRTLRDAHIWDDDEIFHSWRKHVQTHRRHMSLFRQAWPEYFEFRVAAAKSLTDTIGRHRDLGLVADFVRAQPATCLDAKLARAIIKHISKLQRRLRSDALKMGAMLFAQDAKDLSFHVEKIWKISCQSRPGAKSRTASRKHQPGKTKKADTTNPFKLHGGL